MLPVLEEKGVEPFRVATWRGNGSYFEGTLSVEGLDRLERVEGEN